MLLAAALTAEEIEACGPEGSAACVAVFRWTDNELLAKATDWFIAKPLKIAFVVILAIVASRLMTRAIRRFIDGVEHQAGVSNRRVHQRAETIGLVLKSVSRASIFIVAFMTILRELGLDIAPLIAGAGIAGVALGFGAQSLVKDFLSGMFMLVEDQFGVGDVIDAGDAVGTVEAVSLRTTRIRSVDGTLWHVPNGTITRVANKSQEWSRALLDIEVAYATDIEVAQGIIKRVADEAWHDEVLSASILEEPEVWGVESLGASGVVIRTVLKTVPSDQWKVMRALRRRIKEAFDAEGIEIPFPQQTIWVRGNEKTPFDVDETVDDTRDEDDG